MLQNDTTVQDSDVQAAAMYYEDYSPGLIAGSLEDCLPGVAAALMAQWEPAFAASVRQHLELDGWTRIVDENPDLELSIRWLHAETGLSLAKQVVERIAQLDKPRGRGNARALQIMRGLRDAQLSSRAATPSIPNPTNPNPPTTTPSSSLNGVLSAPLPTAIFLAAPAILSESSPRDAKPLAPPTTLLAEPTSLLSGRLIASGEAGGSQAASIQPVPTDDLLQRANARPTSAMPLVASSRQTLDPSELEGGERSFKPPVLPPRGQVQGVPQPGAKKAAPASGAFFSGTPVPKALAVNVASPFAANPGAMFSSTSPVAPQGPPAPRVGSPRPPPAQLQAAAPPQPSAELNHPPPRAPAPVKNSIEAIPDSSSAKEKAKPTHTPNPIPHPRPRRSPAPMDEEQEESGSDSDDEYLPGASNREERSGDEDDEDEDLDDEDEDDDDDEVGEDKEDDLEREELGNSGAERVNQDINHVSGGDSDESEAEAPVGHKKKRERHSKEVKVSTKWTWDMRENDLRVKAWGLEEEINSNPAALHPVRTNWMYEARLGDLSEEDYENVLRSEHKTFMKVPPAYRSVVGKMYYKRAKGDWEARVVLTCLTWEYTKVKIKREEADAKGDKAAARALSTEMMKTLNDGIASLFERFPDLDPEHERRQIGSKLGSDAVTAYVQTLRTKVTSDAGRMYGTYKNNSGTIAMLESKAAGHNTLSVFDIMGKKRKDVAYHLWGGSSSGGRDECDGLIKQHMDRWKKLNPSKTPREISNKSLKVVRAVRSQLFQAQAASVRAAWEEKAKNLHLPKTDEERQCLVDAILPALFRLLTQLSKHTSLHFVLLSSGQGTSNVPVVVHEFSESTDDQSSFLEENAELAQRIRSDYLRYALERHNTGQEEVVEGLPVMHTPDDSSVDASADPTPSESEQPDHGRIPISPFEPNLSVVKSRSQRITYLSRWFMDAGERIVGYKVTWDTFCKNARKYVLTERMPMDPLVEGKRLEIQKPTAMEDRRFDVWWKFMVESYDGTLSEEDRFMFQVEEIHRNLPAPPAPADASVHQAAVNAAKTAPLKKPAATGGVKKGRKAAKRVPSSEWDGLLDSAGLAEDEDEAMLETASDDRHKSQRKQLARKVRRVESPDPEIEQAGCPEKLSPGTCESPGGDDFSGDSFMGRATPDEAVVRAKPRPRARGELPTATEALAHSSFPSNDKAILTSWQEQLVKLRRWGRKMGAGAHPGKVLRYRGSVKKEWASLLPTGLDAAFCILQMWAACQEGHSSLDPISIPPAAGLTSIDSNHPIILFIDRILDPQLTMPTAKVINVGFGASPNANDAFFDFIGGTLTSLLRGALQSVEVFLDGPIDVMQALRLATFGGGTGYIRDLSRVSEQTARSDALVDRLNIFLASLSLVRYHHVVLGGVAQAFGHDERIEGAERVMWVLLKDTSIMAVRSMARAVVERRSDLFDRQRLPTLLPEALDRMVQTAFGLRPWWTHGKQGLPPAVIFTTKLSVASSQLYDTLPLLDWSSLSLLERSQYLLLVFLAVIQIQNGRVTAEFPTLGLPPGPANRSSTRAIDRMTTYLSDLKTAIAMSTEVGDFDAPWEDRLTSANVLQAISRWESESVCPGIIQIPVDEDEAMKSAEPSNEASARASVSPSIPASASDESKKRLSRGSESQPETGSPQGPGNTPSQPLDEWSSPELQTTAAAVSDGASTSSSASKVLYEEEDRIWPEGEEPTPGLAVTAEPGGPSAAPPGSPTHSTPEVPAAVIPAVRPPSPTPLPTPKGKRRRCVPDIPPNWQSDHHDSSRRQLRSNRNVPAQAPATATGSSNTTRRRNQLTVINETQARINASSSRRQSTRSKRPAP
ncbi:hypothetical protein FS837_010474 [Tulasnella sp. UAMH 9824]|nr:hypothetical protein FS837_010474 [Tulasnella sp. UAMH 9824]